LREVPGMWMEKTVSCVEGGGVAYHRRGESVAISWVIRDRKLPGGYRAEGREERVAPVCCSGHWQDQTCTCTVYQAVHSTEATKEFQYEMGGL
jgi:hypothetical protein